MSIVSPRFARPKELKSTIRLLMKRIMAKSNNQKAAKSFLIYKMVDHKVLDEQNKIVSYLNC